MLAVNEASLETSLFLTLVAENISLETGCFAALNSIVLLQRTQKQGESRSVQTGLFIGAKQAKAFI